jgi:hypothetical protein
VIDEAKRIGSRVPSLSGWTVTFWAGRPADPAEQQPQGYLIAQRL